MLLVELLLAALVFWPTTPLIEATVPAIGDLRVRALSVAWAWSSDALALSTDAWAVVMSLWRGAAAVYRDAACAVVSWDFAVSTEFCAVATSGRLGGRWDFS